MSYSASIDRQVYDLPLTEVLCEISRKQGYGPGTTVKSAPSHLQIETQRVADRLLRECFTSKSPPLQAELAFPVIRPRVTAHY